MTKTTNVYVLLILILIAAIGIGLYMGKETPAIEKKTTVHLLGTDCEECFDLNLAAGYLESIGLNDTEIKEYKIEESKELAEQYEIEKLPAVVVENAGNKTIEGFEERKNARVFDKPPAPFYDLKEQRIRGKVGLTIIEPDCKECHNITQSAEMLKELGIAYGDKKTVKAETEEGQELIEKYKIEKLPTLIMDEELSAYEGVEQMWETIGTMENGNFVLRVVQPPYVNVSTGETEGLVKITYLVDEKCEECYDATQFKDLFEQGFKIAFADEETIDVNSGPGRKIVHDYEIELVPTVMFSEDLFLYLGPYWEDIGTIEENGNMVFRKVPQLSYALQKDIVYKNLTSGEIIDTADMKTEEDLSDLQEAEELDANITIPE